MPDDPKNEEGFGVSGFKVLAIFVSIVVIWILIGWILPLHVKVDPNANAGTFGDMFGGVGALFSGLALAGVIYAVILQRRQLVLQQEEIKSTNIELKQQRFENTFFQLLRLHNDIVGAIDLRNNNQVVAVGRDCFATFYNRFIEAWKADKTANSADSEFLRINSIYNAIFARYEADLGHYYRSLYNIVKFVDLSPTENKRLYTNLIRAQLSKYEVNLLFYNCLSEHGSEKFRPLVEKYALLKMVSREDLLDTQHYQCYSPTAYQGPT